jgi:type IV pilus assembly protein PilX
MSAHASAARRPQSGVALIIVLIALTILLISAVALVRSLDTSMLQAGNLAFKRDLKNEAERGVQAAVKLLSNGDLAVEATRNANSPTHNYSSSRLPSGDQGIPLVLLDDALFEAAGLRAGDISDADTGVTVRYVIDRQCLSAGEMTTTACATVTGKTDEAHDTRFRQVKAQVRPVYRISVRARGPRNTQVFIQTTVVR